MNDEENELLTIKQAGQYLTAVLVAEVKAGLVWLPLGHCLSLHSHFALLPSLLITLVLLLALFLEEPLANLTQYLHNSFLH
jgi:hypothetical protein